MSHKEDKELLILRKKLEDLENEKTVFNEKENIKAKIKELESEKKPLHPLKRIGKGFKYMYNKIANSNYVQNIHSDREDADPNKFAPDMSFNQSKKKENKNIEEIDEDPYYTDMSKIGNLKI